MIREAAFVLVLVCAVAQGFQTSFVPFITEGIQMQSKQEHNPNPAQSNQPQVFSAQFHFQNAQQQATFQNLAHHFSPQVSNWFQGQLRNKLNQGQVALNSFRQQMQQEVQTQAQVIADSLRHLMMVHRTTGNFYDGCGVSTSHCDWRRRPKPSKLNVMSKLSKAYNNEMEEAEAQPEKLQMERFCTETKTVCVGNTEHCLTNKDCDMALRITERSTEGESGKKETKIIAISALDMCQWDGLSVEDNSKQSQRYAGVGFASYDDNQQLKCRRLKATDFKLIFLQKKVQTENEGVSQRVCKHKDENDISAVINLQHLAREIETWPTLCESLQGHTENGAFNLKSFLKNHVSVSKHTPFFSPPFDFADNLEYETSSKGMLITGSVIAEE